MVSIRLPSLVLLSVLVASACGYPRGICDGVYCEGNRVCDPMTGGCVADPNPKDAGVVDAGTKDAGTTDAGTSDAGFVDAGTPCVPACACPTPLCDQGSCVDVLPDAGPVVQPIGESCADAAPILMPMCGPARATFRVDLTPRSDEVQGTCGAAAGMGRDAVFIVTVPRLSDVKVSTARAPGSNVQAVTYLRMTPCGTGAELICHDSFGSPTSFRAKALAPGSYALVIDSYGQGGAVDVTVELLDTVTHDTCAAPIDVLTDGGVQFVDLPGAADDLVASCNSEVDSREAVYRVVITGRSDFTAQVSGDPGAGADAVLYLRSSPCADASAANELACVDQGIAEEPEELVARRLQAGTYYLVVEGYGLAGSQALGLTTQVTPVPVPLNDTCAAPRLLNFQGVSSISIPIDTGEAEDDDRGSCSITGGGREVVLYFTLTATRTVTITSESADGGTSVDPVIYLREGACSPDAGLERGCDDAFPGQEVLSQTLNAGTYFLFVDSYTSASAGPTVVTVTLQ